MALLFQYWAIILMGLLRQLLPQAVSHVSRTALKSIGLVVFVFLLALTLLLGTASGRAWGTQQLLWWVNHTSAWHIETQNLQSQRLGQWQAQTLRVYAPNQTQPWLELDDLNLVLAWPPKVNSWHIELIQIARASLYLHHRDPAEATRTNLWPQAGLGRHVRLDQLNIAALQLQHIEYTLNGALEGNLDWQPEAKLPEIDLTWSDADQAAVSFSGHPNAHLWEVTSTFHHHQPSADPRQWPQQSPLNGRLELTADLNKQQLNLNALSIDGWFAPILISAQLQERAEGWHINPLRLEVANQVSALTLQQSPQGLQFDGQWQLPLWLLNPWLPASIAAGWDNPDALWRGQWQWDAAADWALSAHLDTTWHGQPTRLSLAGEGALWRIDTLALEAQLQDSHITAMGQWQPQALHSQIDFDARLKPALLQALKEVPVPAQVEGQILLSTALEPWALDPQTLSADWVLTELDIYWPAMTLLDTPVSLSMSGVGEVSGTLAKPTLQGAWQTHLDAGHEPIFITAQHSEFSAEALNLTNLEVIWRDSFWRGNLGLNPDPTQPWQQWPLELTSPSFELALSELAYGLALNLPIQGRWSGSHQWLGSFAQPKIQLMAQLDADYLEHPLTGQINWQDAALRSRLQWQDRALTVHGTDPLAAQTQWELQAFNLRDEDFAGLFALPLDLSGRHDITITAAGHWDAAELNLTSEHTGLWAQAPITASSDASAHWQAGQLKQWQLNQFSAAWQDASVTATGQSKTGWPEQLEATLTQVPLGIFWSELSAYDAVANGTIQLQSEATQWFANLDLDVQGHQATDLLSGQIGLTASGQELQLTSINLQRFAIGLGDDFGIAGQGGLEQQQWDLHLNWSGLILTPPAAWPGPPAPWRAHGELTLRGEDDDPELQLQQSWESLWVQPDGFTVPWRLEQTIQSSATTHQLNNTLKASGIEQLTLSAQLPRASWWERAQQPITQWPWQVEAHWSTHLSDWLRWLELDEIVAEGLIEGQGQWFGHPEQAQYHIESSLRNGSLQLPMLGLEGSNIAVQLQGNENQPLKLSASGDFGAGQVGLTGALTAAEQTWLIDTQIELNQAALLQRPEAQANASGQLELQGLWPDLTLTGALSLDELQVNLNRIAGNNIAQLDIHNEPQVAPPLWPLDVDIQLTTAGLARLTGNGLDAQLSGDVRLLGSPEAINTEGALTIESGQFNLLTRTFVLTEGQLRLVDETIHLFIVAVHQRGDVMIEATLRGPSDALQLSLRSDPALPEDEIMAQLLFGKAVQNMTPWQALQLASAINQLRGGDSLDLLLATRDTLGLDTLEIETADDQEAPAILRIGRYLNSRVYLEFDTELAAERSLSTRIEVELTPNFYLETQTGAGRGRFNLRWRHDY